MYFFIIKSNSTIQSRKYQILYTKQKQESNSAILPMVVNPIPESKQTSLRFQPLHPHGIPWLLSSGVVLKDVNIEIS